MARHEASSSARQGKQRPAGIEARRSEAPEPEGRRPGAAAQLAAVHRRLREAVAFQLQPEGATTGPRRDAGATGAAASNRSGLPDRLKCGLEALSGLSLDDVAVHRNSSKPAQLNALAYAAGREIHLGPGQERHLPHEAWHVVQQKQGRVRPELQMKGAIAVNLDPGLEREADEMGARSLAIRTGAESRFPAPAGATPARAGGDDKILQAKWNEDESKKGEWVWDKRADGVVWRTDHEFYWFDIVDPRGLKYAAFKGIENKKTHEQWKQLGAEDLAEDVMPVFDYKNNDSNNKVVQAGAKLGLKTSAFVCHRWAIDFQNQLMTDNCKFKAVKLQIKRTYFKSKLLPQAAITFKDHDIGLDSHFFTIVEVGKREMAFDNWNPTGMDASEHRASLKFYGSGDTESTPVEIPFTSKNIKETISNKVTTY